MEGKEVSSSLSISCHCLCRAALIKGFSSIYPLAFTKNRPWTEVGSQWLHTKKAGRWCFFNHLLHSQPGLKTLPPKSHFTPSALFHLSERQTHCRGRLIACLFSALLLLYASLSCQFWDSGFLQTKKMNFLLCTVLWVIRRLVYITR